MIGFNSKFFMNPWKEFVVKHRHLIKEVVENKDAVPACRKLLANIARMELDYPKGKVTDTHIVEEIIEIYLNLSRGKTWKKNFG